MSKANELYIEKLIKIVYFLACNNLTVQELYSKYLEICPKNAAYDSSDSCDSILVALNSHLKEKLINTLINAVDLAIFADEATSAARKEMMELFECIWWRKERSCNWVCLYWFSFVNKIWGFEGQGSKNFIKQ